MTVPRVKGHTLITEGVCFDRNGNRLFGHTEGCAKCSCGALSPWLTTKTARQQWHRDHRGSIWVKQIGAS